MEYESDLEWDRERAQDRAIKSYKNPNHNLLKFVRITKKGFWIFKREEIEFATEYLEEFLERYSPSSETAPYSLSIDSYASDLEKAVKEN